MLLLIFIFCFVWVLATHGGARLLWNSRPVHGAVPCHRSPIRTAQPPSVPVTQESPALAADAFPDYRAASPLDPPSAANVPLSVAPTAHSPSALPCPPASRSKWLCSYPSPHRLYPGTVESPTLATDEFPDYRASLGFVRTAWPSPRPPMPLAATLLRALRVLAVKSGFGFGRTTLSAGKALSGLQRREAASCRNGFVRTTWSRRQNPVEALPQEDSSRSQWLWSYHSAIPAHAAPAPWKWILALVVQCSSSCLRVLVVEQFCSPLAFRTSSIESQWLRSYHSQSVESLSSVDGSWRMASFVPLGRSNGRRYPRPSLCLVSWW